MKPVPAQFLGASGAALAASIGGVSGQPVLLLHGGGQTRHAWDNTAIKLAGAGFRAISVDQRGHGDSDWIESGAYSFGDFGDDVRALSAQIEARFAAKPVAVGASLGGLASLVALARSGAQPCFAGLVLVDIVPEMDPAGVAHVQGFMRAQATEGFASVEDAADAIAAYLPHRPRPKSLDGLKKNLRLRSDGRWGWHWDPRFLDGPRPVASGWESIAKEMDAAMRSLTIPTLLVRGASSELVTEEAAQRFLERVVHAKYANIADARHMVAGDRNDAFGGAVIEFLTEIASIQK
jgi:pimeloyl-ACP methyl ester carboxylesterase